MHYTRTRNLDPIQRKLARDAVAFVCNKFVPRMSLDITIKGFDDLHGLYGDCCWTDDNYRPREFLIRIDKTSSLPIFLDTLMHELVHVKQYAKGELGWNSRSDTTKWQGQAVPRRMKYTDYPWEIEARGREYGLTEDFLEHYGKWWKYVKEGATDYKLCGSSQMVLPFGR